MKAKEITRQADLGFRKGHSARRGWLLKRRWTGTPCSCVDAGLNMPSTPSCPLCYGVGFRCGYYYPMACVWADLDPVKLRAERDDQQLRGSVVTKDSDGLMLGGCLASSADLWVCANTDDRFFLDQVSPDMEVRGIPITLRVRMRLVPFTSIVYTIPVPDAREP